MIERLKDGLLPRATFALLLTLAMAGCVEDLLDVGTVEPSGRRPSRQ